jgi:primosomal protein N''
MTASRRRILRPAASQAADARRHAQRDKWVAKLAKDQQALQTWMRRLRRAFHAIERIQGRITRLQRQVGSADAA